MSDGTITFQSDNELAVYTMAKSSIGRRPLWDSGPSSTNDEDSCHINVHLHLNLKKEKRMIDTIVDSIVNP